MPYINIILTKENGGLSADKKQELIKKLTSSVAEVIGRGETTCVVTINEIDTDSYGIGGKSITQIRKENS